MSALYTAAIYFGTFIVIGWVGKLVLTRWMARRGATLSEVNEQFGPDAGPGAGKRRRFLLGFWYKED